MRFLSAKQVTFTEISPSEFFYRNRDLAGFGNPARALYSALRELVENSLDACELEGTLPDVKVSLRPLTQEQGEPCPYLLTVSDNGPGIDAEQVPFAFGRIFYGSKFLLRQSRGMFGLGGTMSVLYGQITTGRPVGIVTSNDGITLHTYELAIDIRENRPMILNRSAGPADGGRGTTVRLSLNGDYARSGVKINEYIRQSALVAPYARIEFESPGGQTLAFERVIDRMPSPPRETLPHPYGVDVETVRRLLRPSERKLIDISKDALRESLKRELGISLKSLNLTAQEVRRAVSKIAESERPISISNLRADLSEEAQKVTDRIEARWGYLPKVLKTLVALSLQAEASLEEVKNLSSRDVSFTPPRVTISGARGGVPPIREMQAISPLYEHLLETCGGDTLQKFLCKNFHRVGENIARSFINYCGLSPNRLVRTLSNEEMVHFVDCLHRYGEFLNPDASCLSPLGEEILRAGILKELHPEFVATVTRPPSAYSGFPFIVEVGLAYGGKMLQQGLKLFRFANRIPLLYDEGSDVSWKVIHEEIEWKRYKIPESAPLAIITHVCSTKVPYKTVGKEYLADRPEVERELRNAIRDALRKLKTYLSRKGSMEMVKRRINIYAKYLPMIAKFSTELAGMKRPPRYRKLVGAVESDHEGQRGIEEYS